MCTQSGTRRLYRELFPLRRQLRRIMCGESYPAQHDDSGGRFLVFTLTRGIVTQGASFPLSGRLANACRPIVLQDKIVTAKARRIGATIRTRGRKLLTTTSSLWAVLVAVVVEIKTRKKLGGPYRLLIQLEQNNIFFWRTNGERRKQQPYL